MNRNEMIAIGKEWMEMCAETMWYRTNKPKGQCLFETTRYPHLESSILHSEGIQHLLVLYLLVGI